MRKASLARLLARRVEGDLPVRLRTGRDRPGPVPPCLPDGTGRSWSPSTVGAATAAAGPIAGSRSRTGSIRRSAGCRISSEQQRRHWRMRRFEVPEYNGFIAECVRLWDCGLETKDISLRQPQQESPAIADGASEFGRAQHRLLAGRAHIHVDFHSDRHFDDFRCFPGHLVLPFSRRALAIKDGCSPVKSFCREADLRFYQGLAASGVQPGAGSVLKQTVPARAHATL